MSSPERFRFRGSPLSSRLIPLLLFTPAWGVFAVLAIQSDPRLAPVRVFSALVLLGFFLWLLSDKGFDLDRERVRTWWGPGFPLVPLQSVPLSDLRHVAIFSESVEDHFSRRGVLTPPRVVTSVHVALQSELDWQGNLVSVRVGSFDAEEGRRLAQRLATLTGFPLKDTL